MGKVSCSLAVVYASGLQLLLLQLPEDAAASVSFTVAVTLATDAPNALTLTATDAAGNVSEATTLEIVHETGHGIPGLVSLELFVNDATDAASRNARAIAR